jgi:putative nucleotidyltransferase with HDIG domain
LPHEPSAGARQVVGNAREEISRSRRELARLRSELRALREERDLWRRRAQALEAAGSTLASGEALEDLPQAMLELVARAMKAEASSLLLVDPQGSGLLFVVATGEKGEALKPMRLAMGDGIAGWVAAHGEPAVVPDAKKDRRFRRDIAEAIGFPTRDILCVPVRVKHKLIGVVEVLNKQDSGAFDERDLELLRPLAGLAGLATENAQLYRESQRRIAELGTLTGVGMAISSKLELNELLDTIMYLATSVMRVEASSLLLLTDDEKQLEFAVALGDRGPDLKGSRVAVGQGIAGWVAKHGTPLIVNDVTKDPRWDDRIARELRFETLSILCVPMKAGDELVGVIEVLNPIDKKPFDEGDVDLLATLANQAAIAIQNSRLVSQQRELFYSTVDALAALIDADHPLTHGHSRKVAKYCDMIAEKIGMSPERRETLQLAALLHDIGKLAVDKTLLDRPGDLTDPELEAVRAHPRIGANVLRHIEHPQMREVVLGIEHHHERFDGAGFPGHRRAGDIPDIARIICVADAFDAMTSGRPYRLAQSEETAFRELVKCADTQFDRRIVEAFAAAKGYDLDGGSPTD